MRTFTLFLVITGSVCAADKPSSKSLKDLFEKADTLIIYSLDPGADDKQPDPNKGFHGWAILGKTKVEDPKVRAKIVDALYKGLAESDGAQANCFEPRHGIGATVDGKTADVVICFHCLQMRFIVGKEEATEATSVSPRKVLNAVLTKARVPLAPKSD